jgi:hypothetical protein
MSAGRSIRAVEAHLAGEPLGTGCRGGHERALASPDQLLGLESLPHFNHPRMPHSLAPNLWYGTVVRYDPCSWCSGDGGTLEHVEPKSRGGRNSWKNYGGACYECNQTRGNLSIVEFLAVRARLKPYKPNDPRIVQRMARDAVRRKWQDAIAPPAPKVKTRYLGTRSRRKLPTCW